MLTLQFRELQIIYLFCPQNNFRYDFLAIYDGPDSTSTRIGRYCGSLESSFSNLPSDKIIISTTKELFLQFTTDSSVVLKGFRISYKEIGKFLVCTANSKAHNFCHLVVLSSHLSKVQEYTLGNIHSQFCS